MKRSTKIGIFLLLQATMLWPLQPPPAQAQSGTEIYGEAWRWVKYTVETGLPSDFVLEITETTDGTLWARTRRGLAWFDGYGWNPIAARGESGQGILRIVPTPNNQLLVITEGQIFLAHRTGMRPIRLPPLRNSAIHTAVPAPDGGFWLLTWNLEDNSGQLWKYDRDSGRLSEWPLPEEIGRRRKPRLFYTRAGNLWLVGRNGLYRWTLGGWQKQLDAGRRNLVVQNLEETISGRGMCVVLDPMEMAGIWEWQVGERPKRRRGPSTTLIENIALEKNGAALCLLESGRIQVRSSESGRWEFIQFQPPELVDVRDAHFDSGGNVWFATAWGAFLFKRQSRRWSYWMHPNFNLRNRIHQIAFHDDGSIWIATAGGVEVRTQDEKVRVFRKIGRTRLLGVTGLAVDSSGGVWISSGSSFTGAFRWDGKRWTHFGARQGLKTGNVHRIVKDRSGRLWFLALNGTGGDPGDNRGGAFVLEHGKFRRWGRDQGLPGERVYDLIQDRQGGVWFATASGLGRWHNGRWRYWTYGHGLASKRVFCLFLDHRDRMWLGSQTQRLGYIDLAAGEDSLHYDPTYPGGDIWSFAEDGNGRLWVAANDGLWVRQEESWFQISEREGLNYPRVWPIVIRNNRAYIGTLGGGVNILNLQTESIPRPRLIFTLVDKSKNNLFVRWNPLSYMGDLPSSEMESRFRLDGGPWSRWSPQSDAFFTGLNSGRHVFEVQTSGFLGNHSDIYRYHFRIRPPLFLRPSFAVPFLILLSLLIGMLVVHLVNKYRQEARLRESEEKFREIFESANDLIYTHDLEGRLLSVNAAAERLIGLSREKMIGQPVRRFLPADQVALARQMMRKMLRHNTPAAFELEIKDRRGRRIPIEVNARLIWKNKKPIAVQGIARDVSERKIAERQIQNSLAEKTVLLKEIHHRVKNNLQIISSLLNLQSRKVKDPQIAGIIVEGQNRIRTIALIHEMLYQSADLARIDFAEYAEALSNYLITSYARLAEHIELEITADHIHLPVDRAIPCGLILNELLSNAIKHAFPAGRPGTVRVVFHRVAGDCEMILQDDGVGLPENFDPNRSPGLGMSLIRTLADQLNGKLEISNGTGTCVRVRFPFEFSDASSLAAVEAPGEVTAEE